MSEATITVEAGEPEAEAVAEESAAEAVATAAAAVAVAAETTIEAAEAIAEAENGDDEEWLAVFLTRFESVEATLAGLSEMLRLQAEATASILGMLQGMSETLLTLIAQSQVMAEAEAVEATVEAAEASSPASDAGARQEAAMVKRGRSLRLM